MISNNNPLDPETIKAAVRADYEGLRQIARDRRLPANVAGAVIDVELDRLTRAHTEGMGADQAAQFISIYNDEYNRLVVERMKNRSGCAAVVIIAAMSGALLCSALAATAFK